MQPSHQDERGSAMVMALGALAVLALIAIVVMAVVISEKRTSFSDYTGARSFYSADAASEAGVNWLRHAYSPAAVVDTSSHVYVASTYTTIDTQSGYKFDVTYIRKRYRPGWSVEYKDYEYRVDASGQSAQQAAAGIEVRATRLYREGY
jgi:Tfp pilus assembly protein PilX